MNERGNVAEPYAAVDLGDVRQRELLRARQVRMLRGQPAHGRLELYLVGPARGQEVRAALQQADQRVRSTRHGVPELGALGRPEQFAVRGQHVAAGVTTGSVESAFVLDEPGVLGQPGHSDVPLVPHRGEDAAGADDAGQLAVGRLPVEPVVRLTGQRGVHRAIRERHRLGRPVDQLDPGRGYAQPLAHQRIGLHRHRVVTT